MKTIVIGAMGRSGSTMIAETLAKHPAILGGTEIFNHDDAIRMACHEALAGDRGAFAYWPGAYSRPDLYVDLLSAIAAFKGKTVLAFKLMESQCPQLVAMLASRRAYLVHCYRSNFLAAITSWKLASATGIWHAKDDDARTRKLRASKTALPTFAVTPKEVEEWGTKDNAFSELLRSSGLPVYGIPYASTYADPSGVVRRLFDWIEVAPVDVTPAQVKTNGRTLSQIVTNMDELREYFHGTKWEWMTQDEEMTK